MVIKCEVKDGAPQVVSPDFSGLEDAINDLADKVSFDGKWYYGTITDGPSALTNLLEIKTPDNVTLEIVGFMVSAEEANKFVLEWKNLGATKQILIPLASQGVVILISEEVSLNEGNESDPGSIIKIYNKDTGTSGKNYQASVLVKT